MNSTYQNILDKTNFNPPKNWLQIKTIDMHTGGEPLRVIVDGFPELKGNSVLEYRRYCKENFDHLRTALMFEPRYRRPPANDISASRHSSKVTWFPAITIFPLSVPIFPGQHKMAPARKDAFCSENQLSASAASFGDAVLS